MKLFVYKCIIVFFLVIVGFQLTFNYAKRSVEREIYNLSSKENIDFVKSKIRDELKTAIEKENYLEKEDAILINQFLLKVKKELLSN